MRKCFKWQVLTIIVCFFSNFSSNAYTKEDLEHAKTVAAIVELVSALPLEFMDRLPPEGAAITASASSTACFYSSVAGNFCCRALEANEDVISMIAKFLKIVRLENAPVPIFLFLLKTMSLIMANKFLSNKFGGKEFRIGRRCFRVLAFAIIESLIAMFNNWDNNPQLIRLARDHNACVSVGVFIGSLVSNGIAEYIGEKIIQGTEEDIADLLKYDKKPIQYYKKSSANTWE